MEETNRGPVSATPLTPRDGPAVWQIDVPLTQHIGITTRSPGVMSSSLTIAAMEAVNLFTVECSDEMEHEGFRIRETKIGPRLGPDLIGGSVYEVDPGKKLWPSHLHHANEEWLIVLRGRPTLRTPDGERELAEGDVACFPRGAAGTHQLRNNTEEPARILSSRARSFPRSSSIRTAASSTP